jgi:hypothetical protein
MLCDVFDVLDGRRAEGRGPCEQDHKAAKRQAPFHATFDAAHRSGNLGNVLALRPVYLAGAGEPRRQPDKLRGT